jgi:hypothetical protein
MIATYAKQLAQIEEFEKAYDHCVENFQAPLKKTLRKVRRQRR